MDTHNKFHELTTLQQLLIQLYLIKSFLAVWWVLCSSKYLRCLYWSFIQHLLKNSFNSLFLLLKFESMIRRPSIHIEDIRIIFIIIYLCEVYFIYWNIISTIYFIIYLKIHIHYSSIVGIYSISKVQSIYKNSIVFWSLTNSK